MKEPAIVFKDFSFQYKVQHEPTLHDINLTIYKGEKVLILGQFRAAAKARWPTA